MTVPILATKLYMPTLRTGIVPRPRLVEKLNRGIQGPLTLVSAPAGYGKTTLLAEWRSGPGSRTPIAWLSLDNEDNDPSRFLTYLATALGALKAGIGESALAILQSPQSPPPQVILTSLINNLVDALVTPYALVLDDYHVITSQSVHDAITFLLDHLPPQMHLVLLTRADPPLPLANLRARGQVMELRAADLRFTVEEATAFLNQAMGLVLSAEQVKALEQRTEGWVAALQLAALSMQGRDDTAAFISSFTGSHRYIVDYLAEEVLDRQPVAVREFLLKTSILDRLTGALCEAVTDGSGGQAMLKMLAQSNLFLIPLDDERRWFRYHHLFADLLRNRLRQSVSPEALADLHRRASEWFDNHKMLNEAIGHSFAAQEYEEARRLMRDYFPGWFLAENRAQVFQWLEKFPKDFLKAEPWLCLVYAWTVWSWGKMSEAETYLDFAQQALDRPEIASKLPVGDLEYDGLPAEILGFRALIANTKNDSRQAVELANQALALAPEKAHTIRGIAYNDLNAAYRSLGEMDKAIEACRLGLKEAQAGHETGTVVSSLQMLGVTLAIQGRLHEAAQVYREGMEFAQMKGQANFPAYGLIRIRQAELLYEWNRLGEAEDLLTLGLERCKFGGSLWGMIYGRCLLCRILFAREDLQGARRVLSEAEGILSKTAGAYYSEELNRKVALTKARLGLMEDAEMAELKEPGALGDNPTMVQVERALFHVSLQATLKKTEQLSEILSELERVTSQQGNRTWLIQALIPQAVIWQRKGHHARALTSLEKALSLAESERFVRVFLDEGEPMAELLRHARSHGIAPKYVAKLLAEFDKEIGKTPVQKQPLIEPLSERELEILRLVAAGKSNQHIADALIIATGTVKKHLNNIFGKLGVESRTQCIARAREINLL